MTNSYKWEALISFLGKKERKKHIGGKKEKKNKIRAFARPNLELSPFMLSQLSKQYANLTHRSAKRVCVWSVMHYCIAEGSDYRVILRGLNKGQKKEIYFCNKAKMFSYFLLILMQVLHHAK